MPEMDGDSAQTMAIFAALVFDIISEACSSPQTAEINILAREDTLMKWVYLGLVTAGSFVVLGVALDKKRWPPALGGGLAMAIVLAQYTHARNSGLSNPGEPTEQYA